jgi:hypothetical protein
MKKTILIIFAVAMVGCKSMLPSSTTETGPWEEYTQIEQIFKNVEFGETTVDDLRKQGLDLEESPNIQQLTYLDVAKRFGMLGLTPDDRIKIPAGVLKLVQAGEEGKAYEIQINKVQRQREGSFFLDWLKFRRVRHETGWKFRVLIIVIDDTIEYVLYSGNPNVDITTREKNPLGPLQSIEGGAIITSGIEALTDD